MSTGLCPSLFSSPHWVSFTILLKSLLLKPFNQWKILTLKSLSILLYQKLLLHRHRPLHLPSLRQLQVLRQFRASSTSSPSPPKKATTEQGCSEFFQAFSAKNIELSDLDYSLQQELQSSELQFKRYFSGLALNASKGISSHTPIGRFSAFPPHQLPTCLGLIPQLQHRPHSKLCRLLPPPLMNVFLRNLQ